LKFPAWLAPGIAINSLINGGSFFPGVRQHAFNAMVGHEHQPRSRLRTRRLEIKSYITYHFITRSLLRLLTLLLTFFSKTRAKPLSVRFGCQLSNQAHLRVLAREGQGKRIVFGICIVPEDCLGMFDMVHWRWLHADKAAGHNRS